MGGFINFSQRRSLWSTKTCSQMQIFSGDVQRSHSACYTTSLGCLSFSQHHQQQQQHDLDTRSSPGPVARLGQDLHQSASTSSTRQVRAGRGKLVRAHNSGSCSSAIFHCCSVFAFWQLYWDSHRAHSSVTFNAQLLSISTPGYGTNTTL